MFAVALALTTALVVGGAYYGQLTSLLGAISLLILAGVALVRPSIALYVYAALLPFEAAVLLPGDVTLARIIGAVFVLSYGIRHLNSLTLRLLPASLWAFTALSVVSIGWAIDPIIAGGEVATLLQLVVMTLLIADLVHRDVTVASKALASFTLASLGTAVLTIGNAMSGQILIGTRARALEQQNLDGFAGLLVLGMMYLTVQAWLGRRYRLAAGLGSAIIAAALVLTGTRSALLGCIVGLVVVVIPRIPSAQRVALVGLGAVAIIVALQFPQVSSVVSARLDETLAGNASGRFEIWRVGATIYGEHPFLGVGYANFVVAFDHDVVGSTAGVFANADAVSYARAPHNYLVSSIVELGPLGLVFVISVFVYLLQLRPPGTAGVAIRATILAYVILGLFVDILNDKYIFFAIALVLGLSFAPQAGIRAAAAGSRASGESETHGQQSIDALSRAAATD